MPLFGSHLSIAGGYYKAVRSARELGMDCVQIFTKNNNQWRAAPLTSKDVELFRAELESTGIRRPIAHDSYLINLGSADPALWNRSIDALVVELERAAALGIDDVVTHPGTHGGAGEAAGIERIVDGLDRAMDRTKKLPVRVALETTAGQGASIGHRFEHLGEIIRRSAFPDRLSVCLDTCHVFAAGYPLAPKRKFLATFRELDRRVGLERLVAFHLNDSKKPFGSRVDRHEHIGRGFLGVEPFLHLVNDRRFRGHPMYLETPKLDEPESGRPWDAINLELLRGLVGKRSA